MRRITEHKTRNQQEKRLNLSFNVHPGIRMTASLLLLLSFIFLSIRPAPLSAVGFPLNEKENRENIYGLYEVENRRETEAIEVENFFFAPSPPPAEAPKPSPSPLPTGPKKTKVLDVLTLRRIFTFSDLYHQLNTPELLLSAVATNYLLDNDRTLFNDLDRAMKTPEWDLHSPKITDYGEGGLDLALCGLWYLGGTQKSRDVAQMGAEAVVLTGIQVHVLKRMFGVNRPHISNPPPSLAKLGYDMNYDALPSGHVASAFAMATVFGETYRVGWLTYPIAGLVALTRIHEHAHWPSDNLIGALMGHLAAREVLDAHGYIHIKRHSSTEPWGRLRAKIDGGLTQQWDDNANFSSDKAAAMSDQYGYLYLDTRAYLPLSSEKSPPWTTLLQATYRTDRLIYDHQWQNNFQNHLISTRLSTRLRDRYLAWVEADSRVIHYEALEELPDPSDYTDFCRLKTVSAGGGWLVSPDLVARGTLRYRTLQEAGFSNLSSTIRQGELTLGTVPGRSLAFQAGLLSLNSQAEAAPYSYGGLGCWGELIQKIGKTWKFACTYRFQDLNYPNASVPGRGTRRDSLETLGVSLENEFSGHWSVALRWNLRTANSNDPTWRYTRNILSAGFTNRF